MDPNKLNVHLIAHTHNDVGWLKTVEQYYYGSNSKHQKAGVENILDSVVDSLQRSTQRKFIYVETAFFWKWWNHKNETFKGIVKQLVYNGQLELTGGGWSSNDEGSSHYNSVIDQMTWGFKRLYDIFGKCGIPKVAWQIDQFGHSREMASLFGQMNFDAFFFSRIDNQDKHTRETSKTMEMVWSGNDDLGISSSIFTNVMADDYVSPKGFCFDLIHCNDDPIIDDPQAEDYNVHKKVDDFIKWCKSFSHKYKTNNILIPMGVDFAYEYAESWYKNMDKLIKYINMKNETKINVVYSTPSCYAYAVQQTKNVFTVKTDDFFPLWSGYLSSRPSLKRYERIGNNILQICKQLDSIALQKGTDEDIAQLREAMGELQHHDAITGTSKQFVANNYYYRLSKGISKCESVIKSALNKILVKDEKLTLPNQYICKLNISECSISEGNKSFTVTIYNPIAHRVNEYIRIPISNDKFIVKDNDGKDIDFEIIPIAEDIIQIPGRKSIAKHEIVFKSEIKSLEIKTYFIKFDNNRVVPKYGEEIPVENNKVSVKGKDFMVHFDANGILNEITLNGSENILVKQLFSYYKEKRHHTNSYAFDTDGEIPINIDHEVKHKFYRYKHYTEIHQKYTLSGIRQIIRVYPDEDFIEFDWVIGPVPINDGIGKQIITRIESDFNTNKIFYTDSNGRQMMKRIRNHKDSYNYTPSEPIPGNYYPINSRIAMRDEKKGLQLTLLTDRSHGGTSVKDGAMEVMIHRRLLYGGVFEEPLNETGFDGKGLVVRGKQYLIPSKISDAAKLHRDLSQKLFMKPLITFAHYENVDDYRKNYHTSYSAINEQLPENIHLLTLEQWRNGTYLLRLEHFYESGDDNVMSKPLNVSLRNLFKPFTIVNAIEMTLGANQILNSRKRLEFHTSVPIKNNTLINVNDLIVKINPMEIRTFVITVKKV